VLRVAQVALIAAAAAVERSWRGAPVELAVQEVVQLVILVL
jgi:hypothetical protein